MGRSSAWALMALLVGCGGGAVTSGATAPSEQAASVVPGHRGSEALARAVGTEPPPSEEALAEAAHVLDRFAFGPRPGEVETVACMGARVWIEAQLYPERIEDVAGEAALEPHRWVLVPPGELFDWFDETVSARDARRGRIVRRVEQHVQMTALARHVASEHQLEEVLVDVFTNHFHVSGRKGPVRWYVADYVEHAIRPHVLGRFEDMLMATAKHPAMLLYLDNERSIAPGSRPNRPERGLNENYARELLELHTVGVEAGYAQRDVVHVARILTGWSIRTRRPVGGDGFLFRARLHDTSAKEVMGRAFPEGGGVEEGEALLRFLAHHPATARRVATKLLQRFVADEPPASCVRSVADAYLAADTDLRATMEAVVACDALWDPGRWRQKVKSPLELVVSSIRALGGRLDGGVGPALEAGRLGQPPFADPVPTGYPEAASDWVSPGAMLERTRFATRLVKGEVDGVVLDLPGLVGDDDAAASEDNGEGSGEGNTAGPSADLADRVISRLLVGRASGRTRDAVAAGLDGMEDPAQARAVAVALALSAPEFQRQ